MLQTTPALKTIAAQGNRLMQGIHLILSEKGIPHTLTGLPAMFSFVLGLAKPPREYRDLAAADMGLYEKIHAAMRARGIEYEMDGKEPWFLCEAHTQADIDRTLTSLAEVVKRL